MDLRLEPMGQVAGQEIGSAKAVGGERGGGEGTAGAAQDFSLLVPLLFIWVKLDLRSSLSTAVWSSRQRVPGSSCQDAACMDAVLPASICPYL